MEQYSALKNNEMMPVASFATWMDLEIITLSEVRHAEKEIYHITSLITSCRERDISYNITYKNTALKWYKWTYLQNRNRLKDIENKYMVTKEDSRSGEDIN